MWGSMSSLKHLYQAGSNQCQMWTSRAPELSWMRHPTWILQSCLDQCHHEEEPSQECFGSRLGRQVGEPGGCATLGQHHNKELETLSCRAFWGGETLSSEKPPLLGTSQFQNAEATPDGRRTFASGLLRWRHTWSETGQVAWPPICRASKCWIYPLADRKDPPGTSFSSGILTIPAVCPILQGQQVGGCRPWSECWGSLWRKKSAKACGHARASGRQ